LPIVSPARQPGFFFASMFIEDKGPFNDPKTGLLYNLVGAKDSFTLDTKEGIFFSKRLLELQHPKGNVAAPAIPAPAIPAVFDEKYLRHLHGYLFQDVYPWAGETRADRDYQSSKLPVGQPGYIQTYAHYKQITPNLDVLSKQLAQENNLKGLDKEQFIKRAAYYMDQYNHVHAFREGNGRVVQTAFAELGKQAGYKVDLSPDYREFNPARDTALLAVSTNPHNVIGRLESLLRRQVKPLPGKEAAEARNPIHARPLSAPTLEVARIEALRELKASAQPVNIRLNQIRTQTKQDNFFTNLQYHIMRAPENVGRYAKALHNFAQEAATAPAKIGNGPAQLDRYHRAIDRTVQLFQGQGQQHQVRAAVQQEPKGEKAASVPEVEQQKAPEPKLRGPRM
jgi:cell filamentation protein